ncbi:MAG: hypothetical protein QOJ13_3042 [Gaiellales bacterium]|jgi:uncharacterized membrane protein YoaK (UPF0700 family)|nr:hypothetical protein [Gaiellales bacterium]MDX6593846.1 hypothetical protein [Gaiellales bacterium]
MFDLLLAGMTFAAGSVDAIAFLGLDKVFSTFMTGNLVFLGLGMAGVNEPDFHRVVPALCAFAVGVFLAVLVVKPTRGSGVWPARVSVALGISALAQAAFLAGWMATSGRPAARAGDVLIGLSALAFGIQSGAVMSLDVKGVFTTAATATVIMFMSAEAGWTPSDRRRLAGVIVGMVAGAAAGAFLLLHARSYAPILPLAVTLAVIAGASFALRSRQQTAR